MQTNGDELVSLLQPQGQGGSVTLIQRFGSAANLNIHLHCLVLDGVYQIKRNGELAFIQTPAPTDQALQLLLRSIITSTMKRLVRQGVFVQEQDQWYAPDAVADDTETSALRPLQQGSIVYRIAFGPRAGRKVLTLREASKSFRGHKFVIKLSHTFATLRNREKLNLNEPPTF